MIRRLIALALVLAVAGCSDPNPAPTVTWSAPATTPPRADGAPSAREVVDAFAAAGLPVPEPRDGACAAAHCSELMTTDAVSVYVFPDEASAAAFADAHAPDAHRIGVVVLDYAAARTPADDRSQYENALTNLV